MISLIGLCLLFMTLYHWLLEPIEHLITPLLELQNVGFLAVAALIWIFASTGEVDT